MVDRVKQMLSSLENVPQPKSKARRLEEMVHAAQDIEVDANVANDATVKLDYSGARRPDLWKRPELLGDREKARPSALHSDIDPVRAAMSAFSRTNDIQSMGEREKASEILNAATGDRLLGKKSRFKGLKRREGEHDLSDVVVRPRGLDRSNATISSKQKGSWIRALRRTLRDED